MTIPTTIFIDTCIFDDSKYNFNLARYKAFDNLAKKYQLILLVPDPTDREIRSHIGDRSQAAVKSLENAARNAPFLCQLDTWPLNGSNRFLIASQLAHQIEKGLSEFYKNFTVHKLDYKGIKIQDIMDWYYWGRAPF